MAEARNRRPGVGRDRERSGLAGDGVRARGRSLDRRSAEGVLRRLEERAPKKHSRKEVGGASGPDRRTRGTCARKREKPRRAVAEPGPNRRDRERSGLAGDSAGAKGSSLGRRSAEGVRRRPEERAAKKHSSKEAGGASGPRPPDNRHLRPESGQREHGN
ncbi:hypothetical protein NDU88_005062 [Pleurodeles waltl]|uniref:Uncharacterized protein n=1 Tax=Pleurodeles waltl TaxID=8319 RepID=A0AAV7RHF5_PLEWA|nr:hypothetical protein NDU88_005062 [Pleurodeles waltl]